VSVSELARLAELGVATVYEASRRTGLLSGSFVQLQPGSRAAGRARIARCAQDDNLAAHAVMEHVEPGDVLVLSMPEPRPIALMGDLLAVQAHVRGVAAVLVDAAVRDREEIERLGLPVWARWVHAAGADKLDPGEIDRPVTIGGVQIAPGDVIVLDADGVVVVERAALQATLAATELRFGKEEMLRGRLETGELTLDLMGLRRRDDATA